MGGAPEERAANQDELIARLCDLEHRVARLEHERHLEAVPAAPVALPQSVAERVPGGVIPILGRALLGMAGAYLLRAIAESGAVPQLVPGVAGALFCGGGG